jgi:hypothetical protein
VGLYTPKYQTIAEKTFYEKPARTPLLPLGTPLPADISQKLRNNTPATRFQILEELLKSNEKRPGDVGFTTAQRFPDDSVSRYKQQL